MAKKKQTANPKKKPSNARRLPRQPRRKKIVQRLHWQGVTISVSYEPDWLGVSRQIPEASTAHLEIEAVAPKRAALPITDTGYRSHFLARCLVEQAGGPVVYAKTWLDEAAKSRTWKRREEQSRQLSLF